MLLLIALVPSTPYAGDPLQIDYSGVILVADERSEFDINQSKARNVEDMRSAQKRNKPPLTAKRITGEILGGLGGGILAGGMGAATAGLLSPDPQRGFDQDRAVAGFLIGYALGSAIGVRSAGNTHDETANSLAVLGGSVFGLLLGYGAMLPHISLGLCPIGAAIGFNMTRRYKTPLPAKSGLINFKDAHLCIGVPQVNLQPDPIEGKALVHNIDLLSASF